MTNPASADEASTPPKLPIPTGFGWLLLESILGRSPLSRLAESIGQGAAALGFNQDKITQSVIRQLNRLRKSGKASPAAQATLTPFMTKSLETLLQASFPADQAKCLSDTLRHATGPFTPLAAIITPKLENSGHNALLALSKVIDDLGAAFAAAMEQNNFALARNVLIESPGLDGTFWAAPEWGFPDAEANITSLRGSNNWSQLTRASAPLIYNITLCWLSLLDIATLCDGKYRGANFSLFQPLITKPTRVAVSSEAFEADRQKLPVSNLVRMIEAIAEDVAGQLKHSDQGGLNKGERSGQRDSLDIFKKHDLLSIVQFNNLLTALEPKPKSKSLIGVGFDIYSLLLATNLLSFLTPRDSRAPDHKQRRDAHKQIICHPGIEAGYLRWWAENRQKLAVGTTECPRPAWFSRL